MAPKGPNTNQPRGIALATWLDTEQKLAQHMAMIVAAFWKELHAQVPNDQSMYTWIEAVTVEYAKHLLARHKDFSLIVVPSIVPPEGPVN